MIGWLLELIGGIVGAGWIRNRFTSAAHRNRSPWRKRARFSREVRLAEAHDSAEARVRRVLASMGTLREAPEIGALEAVTEAGIKSNGTIIHVQLVGGDQGTRVEVAAWPGAQLFGWGESRRVVEQVIAALGPTLPVEPPQASRFR